MKPSRVFAAFRLNAGLVDRLKAAANTSNLTTRQLVEMCLERSLGEIKTIEPTPKTVEATGKTAVQASGPSSRAGDDEAPSEMDVALTRYRQYVVDRYRYLDFKGLGVADRTPLKLELRDMFVPLKARVEIPKSETWDRRFQVAGRPVDEGGSSDGSLGEPVPLIDVLKRHPGLVILGDPGAGKTTFLKHLALLHATCEPAERLPVLVPLSAYANALAERELRLDDFIASYFDDIGSTVHVGKLLRQALEHGSALVMLDGLDEVADLSLRETLVRRVSDFFTFHRRAGNKFVITSRIVGYREVRPTADELGECTLVDFDQSDIKAFVTKWTSALEKAAGGDNDVARHDAVRERRDLLDAIQRNPGVHRLAANPLMLTVLALMKRQGVTLPERRVELYQKYIETLLSSWNRARGLGRAPTRDLDVMETVKMLAPLARWMHTVSPGLGLVKKADLVDELQRLYRERGEPQPEVSTRRFLDDVRNHTSVLLERGPGLYGFIHLTFEEYLAAVALAHEGQQAVEPIVQAMLACATEPAWREVIVLAVGYLGIVQQRDQAAGSVVRGLLAEATRTKGLSVVLAGEAVADACPGGVSLASRDATVSALLRIFKDSAGTSPYTRAKAGNALARLGDPRPGIVPNQLKYLCQMKFCYVSPGPFIKGDKDCKITLTTEGFWIGRYPITVAQYKLFVREGGYGRTEFWEHAIRDGVWKHGKFKPDSENDWASGPRESGFESDLPNHPVVGVSWYEAVAFANWLNEQGKNYQTEAGVIRLPTELELEKSARGGKEILTQALCKRLADGLVVPEWPALIPNPDPQREFPWLGGFNPNNANAAKTQIGVTSSVGCFQDGASPCGVLELSGNVWEWCNDKIGNDRLMRGGSWWCEADQLRCISRMHDRPDRRLPSVGFRVVWVPAREANA